MILNDIGVSDLFTECGNPNLIKCVNISFRIISNLGAPQIYVYLSLLITFIFGNRK